MGTVSINIDVTAAATAAAAEGLNLVAQRVLAVTVPRTPVDTGDLRGSLTVNEASAGDLTASVSTDNPYAVRQHEDLSLRHEEGEAKFLETSALEVAQSEAAAIMAGAAKRHMGGG